MTETECARLVKRLSRDPRLTVEMRGRTCIRITNNVMEKKRDVYLYTYTLYRRGSGEEQPYRGFPLQRAARTTPAV